MQTVGPITLVLSLAVTESDPAQVLGITSVNVQVQNSSSFVLSILTSGDEYNIQPFTAQTIPVGGQPIIITPTQNPSGLTDADTITLVWLLTGESPPQQDGPLTAAATTAAISGINFTEGAIDVNVQLVGGAIPPPTGAVVIAGSLVLAGSGSPRHFGASPLTVGISVISYASNSGLVGIGNAAGQPFPITPGQMLPFLIPVADSSEVYCEGTAGDVVGCLGA